MLDIFGSIREYVLQELLDWIWINHSFLFGLFIIILLILGLSYFSRVFKKNLNFQLMIGAELEKQLEKQTELLDKRLGLLRALKSPSEGYEKNDQIRLVE